MLARWYLLLGQFSVTFEYRPGAQHANVDGMSRQYGQCQRPDCLVSSSDSQVAELDTSSALLDQPFASSEMGDSMDAELSGEAWVAATLLEGLTADLLPAGSDLDLIVVSVKIRVSRLYMNGYSRGRFRHGLIAPDFLRNYGVGDYRLGICRWMRRRGYGDVERLHPARLSWLFLTVSVRI